MSLRRLAGGKGLPGGLHRWWPALANLSGLLEKVAGLENLEIGAMGADDLDPDGQAAGAERGRDTGGRAAGGRDQIGRAHPVQVVGHRPAVDLARVLQVNVER